MFIHLKFLEQALKVKRETYWQLILMCPNTAALSLFNNLFDVHENRQCHTAGCKTDGELKKKKKNKNRI